MRNKANRDKKLILQRIHMPQHDLIKKVNLPVE